jgi:hypothetical protein
MKQIITVSVKDVYDNTVYDKMRPQETQCGGKESFEEYLDLVKEAPLYRIYVIRDGDVIFYIGKSIDIPARLGEHLGIYGRRGASYPDRIGYLILDNMPESKRWQVDLMTVAAVAEKLDPAGRWRWDVDFAERDMIKALRPCVNVMHNSNGSALPERYLNRKRTVVV